VRLVRSVRSTRPEVVYSWLPTANVFAIAMKPFLADVKVVASVHGAGRDMSEQPWQGRFSDRLHLRMVRWSDRVIVNSMPGLQEMVRAGVRKDKLVVVPNGTDVERFRRDEIGRTRLRSESGVMPGDVLFGVVSTRLEPVKGHDVFLRAAAIVKAARPDARFVCYGQSQPDRLAQLRALGDGLGLADSVEWPGIQTDMAAVYSALDVLVCSSHSEGGPNVVAEAMACGTPCVVTDVGHAAEMVGDTGLVVPTGDPQQLAGAMLALAERLPTQRDQLRKDTRQRIVDRFGMETYVSAVLEALRPD
jgi:glycosyltransferase involved in cell wall biosynthesis